MASRLRYADALVRVVQARRPYTKHTSTEIARCVGCLSSSSGWFKHIEPHRTFTNHTSTEIARCSGWFKHIEHHRTLHKVLWFVRFDEVRCA